MSFLLYPVKRNIRSFFSQGNTKLISWFNWSTGKISDKSYIEHIFKLVYKLFLIKGWNSCKRYKFQCMVSVDIFKWAVISLL